ncbi:MAG: tetratricopeptide repeat protein [Candidatus Brocadiae bacterium]|nr:tetratricopeptide repeat protein [Candidatus Brocadiia bacterium]
MMRFFLGSLIIMLILSSGQAQEAKEIENKLALDLNQAMRLMDYKQAVSIAQEGLEKAQDKDYFLYMKALAQYHQESLAESEESIKLLLKKENPWQYKGRFLLGRIFLKRKDYKSLENIYSQEATRLHAQDRKDHIARVYIQFAEALEKKPEPEDLQASEPDYNKAYFLYQKALDLKPGDALSEEIRMRLGKTSLQAKNYYQAIDEFRRYLEAYDSLWQGMPGNPLSSHPSFTTNGKYSHQVRYFLSQSLIYCQRFAEAREILEDLSGILLSQKESSKDLIRDTLWEICTTYRIPDVQEQELGQAVASLKSYLKEFPESLYSVEAAYSIAAVYSKLNRTEEAIAAFRNFLNGVGYKVMASAVVEQGKETPQQVHERLRKEATYNLGKLYAGQKAYKEAMEIWKQYTAQFPDGPHWSDSQQGILNAEYQMGEDLVASQKYDEARAVWESFMVKYPLDERTHRILYTFGAIQYALACEAREKKDASSKNLFQKAIQDWEKLISKYPNSTETPNALFMTGRIYEEELGDLKKALESYRKVNSGKWYQNAQQRIQQMTLKHLSLSTERIYRGEEIPKVKVSLRNVKKLNVRMYKLNMEEYFRKEHTIREIEKLDIALIEPDRLWEFPVEKYAPYLPLQEEIPLPVKGPGVYAVHVSDDELEATTLVLSSNLDIIIKSSRKEILVYVQNMQQERPENEARVMISDGEKIFLQGKTNADGVFLQQSDKLKDASKISVFVEKEGHIASNLLSLQGLGFSLGLSPKGYIFSDRTAYKPGESVGIKAIVRDVMEGSYIVPQKGEYRIHVFDPAGKCLFGEEVKLNGFGSGNVSFVLPENAALGTYRMEVYRKDREERFQGNFVVSAFQLQKIKLSLSFPHRVYFRGESIEATFQASYYYGTPLSEKPLRYTLPDGRSFVVNTDNKGQAKVTFDTSRMQPGASLRFTGSLESEGVFVEEQIFLAQQGFSIQVSSLRSIVLSGESVEMTVKTTDSAGKPSSETLVLAAYRQVENKASSVLDSLPWKETRVASMSEVKAEEKSITTDKATGIARVTFSLEAGGNYIFRATGKDRFGNVVEGKATLFVSDSQDKTKLRIFSQRQNLKVGESLEIQLHSRLEKGLALVTYEGETILGYKILSLVPDLNPLKIAVGHEHFPNFNATVSMMSGKNFYEARENFTVERELKLQIAFDKKQYQPGEKAKLTATATNNLDHPVVAEIAMALVDEALFAIYPEARTSIVDYFQKGATRVSQMRTQTSCTFAYQGKTKKVDQSLLAESKRIISMEKKKEAASAPKPIMMPSKSVPIQGPQSKRRAKYGDGEKDKIISQSAEMEESLDMPQEEIAAEPDSSIRKEIAALGWWSPCVVTQEDGKATVEITMPEKITQWRLTAIGCTAETLVGETKDTMVTSKNFFVDIKSPEALREGDKVRIFSRIHNLSDVSGTANLVLEIQAGESRIVQPKHIFVPANQTIEFVFDAETIPAALDCKIKVFAEIKDKGISDAISSVIPVIPWGMEYASYKSGVAKDSVSFYLALPEPQKYLSRWMNVVVSPTMSKTILDLVLNDDAYCSYFADRYAFGMEASRILSYSAALEYAAKVQTNPGEYQRILSMAKTSISSVVASQKEDGGWRLSPKESYSHVVLSARILWGLALLKRQGLMVEEDTMAKAVAYLKQAFSQIETNDEETKALVQYVLSLLKESNFTYANRLHRQRNSMGTAGLSYTALLLHSLDKKEMAEEVLDTLEKHKINSKEGSLWSKNGNSSWTSNDTESTALVTLAFAQIRPQSPRVKEGVDRLLALRYGWRFSPEHAKGVAVYALTSYFKDAQYAQSDYRLKVLVNDKEIMKIEGKDNSPIEMAEVPGKFITKGRNRVEFRFEGNGTYNYAVTLRGFSEEIRDPNSWRYPHVSSRTYRHASLEYKGNPISAASTSPVYNAEQGQRVKVNVSFYQSSDSKNSQYFMVEEPLPSGMFLLADTIQGNFSYYERNAGKIFFYFSPNSLPSYISYEMAGYAPGEYRILPTILRDAHNPSQMRIGKVEKMTVLAPGEKTPDPYEKNISEFYELGRLYFEDKDYKNALHNLSHLFQKERNYQQREVARMLLWIYTEKEYYDAQKIVDFFEILKEKYTELYIPFNRILMVGKAYKDIREYERAYLVYQATLEASFEEEAKVGGILEDQGQFLGSVDYMKKLWMDYHDSGSVIQAYFGLSQALYARLSQLEELKNNFRLKNNSKTVVPPTKQEMLQETIDLLEAFLSFYSQSPQADDAAFSLALAYLSLDHFEKVVQIASQSLGIYKESDFLSSFQYMEALGHFSSGRYEKAVEQARIVADGKSKDKDYATYILGQIYHAQGKATNAIEFYSRIQNNFPDAKEAISYFERRYIRLPEIVKILPGEKSNLELQYSNIKEAQFLVYRVDLMKLYLQQKNLSGITKVHLAGISPVLEKRFVLGDGKDYKDMKQTITLSLEKEGAYLVICRGDDLFTSGLLLITSLQTDVQEDPISGRVRVNVLDAVNKTRPKGIHVKVIGSASNNLLSGDTDLRGIFVADNIQGKVTVIARQGKDLYAFHRGETWLGSQVPAPVTSTENEYYAPVQQQKSKAYDFRSNLEESNRNLQEKNVEKLRRQMRSTMEGVQVDMAK